MKTNDAMGNLLKDVLTSQELKPALAEILSSDFCQKGEYVFIGSLLKKRHVPSTEEVGDATGVEVFVNSFHTDDYIESDHLEQALAFARELQKRWGARSDRASDAKLTLVLAMTEFGVNVKLFQRRVSQPYLADDLNTYKQPILAIEIS